jgi:hypothetical protein
MLPEPPSPTRLRWEPSPAGAEGKLMAVNQPSPLMGEGGAANSDDAVNFVPFRGVYKLAQCGRRFFTSLHSLSGCERVVRLRITVQ